MVELHTDKLMKIKEQLKEAKTRMVEIKASISLLLKQVDCNSLDELKQKIEKLERKKSKMEKDIEASVERLLRELEKQE